MPHPTRPPERRTNQGALVVILTAVLGVNLLTLGLLWYGGFLGANDPAVEAPVVAETDHDPAKARADEERPRPATQRPAAPTHEPPARTATPAPPRDRHDARPQVAQAAPDAPDTPAADPPLEFFGMPLFE